MSPTDATAVGLPTGFTLCAKCGTRIAQRKNRGRIPTFPTETMALFNNFNYLLLLRRVGKTKTYKVVGWR